MMTPCCAVLLAKGGFFPWCQDFGLHRNFCNASWTFLAFVAVTLVILTDHVRTKVGAFGSEPPPSGHGLSWLWLLCMSGSLQRSQTWFERRSSKIRGTRFRAKRRTSTQRVWNPRRERETCTFLVSVRVLQAGGEKDSIHFAAVAFLACRCCAIRNSHPHIHDLGTPRFISMDRRLGHGMRLCLDSSRCEHSPTSISRFDSRWKPAE